MNPAVLLVAEQLSVTTQLPPWQHFRAFASGDVGVDSPDSVTVTVAPSAAAEQSSVVVATPAPLKLTLAVPSVQMLAARLAVCPASVVMGFVQGLVLSAQAVTVTVAARHATLPVGSESS